MMEKKNFSQFINQVGIIFLVVLLLLSILGAFISWFIGNNIIFSYSSFPSYVLASVAVSSLYVAWREFWRKTNPKVTMHLSRDYAENSPAVKVKLSNTGPIPVRPINIWYAVAKKDGDEIGFYSQEMSSFQDEILDVGEETEELYLEKDAVVLQVKSLNIQYGQESGQSIDYLDSGRGRVHNLKLVENDSQVPVQKILDKIIEWDKGYGGKIKDSRLDSKTIEEFVEENLEYDEEIYEPGFWESVRERYVYWKYGYRVTGRFGSGPVITLLELMEDTFDQKDK